MPELNAACTKSCLLGRVNFAEWPHLTGMPKTEAFRASGGVKALRIQVSCQCQSNFCKSGLFWTNGRYVGERGELFSSRRVTRGIQRHPRPAQAGYQERPDTHSNELPRRKQRGIDPIRLLSPGRHSGLDPESRIFSGFPLCATAKAMAARGRGNDERGKPRGI
jgi:hypothetical protein